MNGYIAEVFKIELDTALSRRSKFTESNDYAFVRKFYTTGKMCAIFSLIKKFRYAKNEIPYAKTAIVSSRIHLKLDTSNTQYKCATILDTNPR